MSLIFFLSFLQFLAKNKVLFHYCLLHSQYQMDWQHYWLAFFVTPVSEKGKLGCQDILYFSVLIKMLPTLLWIYSQHVQFAIQWNIYILLDCKLDVLNSTGFIYAKSNRQSALKSHGVLHVFIFEVFPCLLHKALGMGRWDLLSSVLGGNLPTLGLPKMHMSCQL